MGPDTNESKRKYEDDSDEDELPTGKKGNKMLQLTTFSLKVFIILIS